MPVSPFAPVPAPVPTPSGNLLLDVTGGSAAAAAAANAQDCVPPLEFLQRRGGSDVFLTAIKAANLTNLLSSKTAVETVFAPTDSAFVALLQSQGIRESQLLEQTDKLKTLLQNHILPNVNARTSGLTVGSNFPTINPDQVLSIVAPVAPVIVGADLQACNTVIQEVSVVLVPPNVLPLGPGNGSNTAAAAAAQTPVPVPVPSTTTPAAATAAAEKAVSSPTPVTAPSSTFSSNIDVSSSNVNLGSSSSNPGVRSFDG